MTTLHCFNNCSRHYVLRDNAAILLSKYQSDLFQNHGILTKSNQQSLTDKDICIILAPKVGFTHKEPCPLVDVYDDDDDTGIGKIRMAANKILGAGLKIVLSISSAELPEHFHNNMQLGNLTKLINDHQGKILIPSLKSRKFSLSDAATVLNALFSDDPSKAIDDLVGAGLQWL